MSGRGCTISINLISGSSKAQQQQNGAQQTDGIFNSISTDSKEKEKVDDCILDTIILPVALHTPLSILKDQLCTQTGIAREAQVLILLDLTDPERNRDQLLSGRDAYSLRDCGIKNGSVLTLHALGLQFERAIQLEGKLRTSHLDPSVKTLSTRIMPSQADHSYSGVIFDIECSAPYECDIISLGIGGMLGRIRIFVRDKAWEEDKPESRPSATRYWTSEGMVSKKGWTLVADLKCKACWDSTREVFFENPITMLPGTRRGVYVHSDLPDDLGLQYQSYRKDHLVASDDVLKVWPGLGHVGGEPFDDVHGWFREFRCHAGDINYRSRLKGWCIPQHLLFPEELRQAVRSVLLCHAVSAHPVVANNNSSVVISAVQGTLSRLPTFLVYHILEFMHWDWFVELREMEVEEPVSAHGAAASMMDRVRRIILANPALAAMVTDARSLDVLVRHFLYEQGVDLYEEEEEEEDEVDRGSRDDDEWDEEDEADEEDDEVWYD